MGKLSNSEIDKLIEKIRKKYVDAAKVHGENRFNVKALNERYFNALRNRIDMQTFLYAEVLAFDDIINEIEKERKDLEDRAKIRKQLEEISEEHIKLIAGYPDCDFHEKASFEVSKLFGALKLYYNELFIDVKRIIGDFKDLGINNRFKPFIKIFEEYCAAKIKGLSPKMEDYTLIINKFGSHGKDYEKEEQKYLQSIAVFLNDYLVFLKLIVKESNNYQFVPDDEISFLQANVDFINKMIVDFRFSSFKKEKKLF